MLDTMVDVEAVAKAGGFESWHEMAQMVARVDLAKVANLAPFIAWKNYDGTKAGLEELLRRPGVAMQWEGE